MQSQDHPDDDAWRRKDHLGSLPPLLSCAGTGSQLDRLRHRLCLNMNESEYRRDSFKIAKLFRILRNGTPTQREADEDR